MPCAWHLVRCDPCPLLQVYGSDNARGAALRAFSGGKMIMESTPVGTMLPRNTAGLPNANDAHVYPDNQLYLGGGTVPPHPSHA